MKIIKSQQYIIESKTAKSMGKKEMEQQTIILMQSMFNDMCRVLLNADNDKKFLVNWGEVEFEGEEDQEIQDILEEQEQCH